MSAPEPEEIYRRTREEGQRRLSRPLVELGATAFVAGVDVVFGIVALFTTTALTTKWVGPDAAHFFGSIAFGIAFVFIVVGRSELFTENFLVPIAGLERTKASWYKLGELWAVSPIMNLLGGGLLLTLLTVHHVLPHGTGKAAIDVGAKLADRGPLAAFMSAIGAGALITLMTWLVEGAETMGTRIVAAWIAGAVLTVTTFNHVIVVTLEMFAAIRYGAPISWSNLLANLGIAAAGNLVGGLLFVTLTRFGQAVSSNNGSGSSA
jgi:formate/nitrite transporter FocA (FNT family)